MTIFHLFLLNSLWEDQIYLFLIEKLVECHALRMLHNSFHATNLNKLLKMLFCDIILENVAFPSTLGPLMESKMNHEHTFTFGMSRH